jgi:hypothetical protein
MAFHCAKTTKSHIKISGVQNNEILGWEGVGKNLFFSFFAMFYIKNRITNDSYYRSKYPRSPFANNKHVQSFAD